MTEDEARQAALELVHARYEPEREGDEIIIDEARTQAGPIGWVFWVESRHYLETEAFDASPIRVEGIFVERSTRKAIFIAGKTPTDLEVQGSPGHDWPTRAWLGIPLAFLAQAGVWAGCWILHDLLVRVSGVTRLPVSVTAVLVIGIVATGPTALAVRWTKFANVDRRIPIAVVLAGALLGELAVSLYFLTTAPLWLELGPSIEALPRFFAAQSPAPG